MMAEWLGVAGMFGEIDVPLRGGPIGKLPTLLMRDIVLIVAMGLVLFGLMVYWARYLRNKRRSAKEPIARRVYRDAGEPADGEESAQALREARRRYKYRWKRRKHRKRKPTLAETGGLPPTRPEEEAESP